MSVDSIILCVTVCRVGLIGHIAQLSVASCQLPVVGTQRTVIKVKMPLITKQRLNSTQLNSTQLTRPLYITKKKPKKKTIEKNA